MLSVIIPTLESETMLGPTLAAVTDDEAPFALEVVVSDGGSADGTRALAEARGCRVVAGPPGRGRQLAAGAAASRGDWLLFLHADTVLERGWSEAVRRFVADPANAGRAGHFRLALDDPSPAARRIERLAAWRCRALGLPYGDQGLLIGRGFHDALGGFRPLPLMEDVELVRRIGRRNLVALDARAVTSAARYRRDGWWLRPLRNLGCLGLYLLGVPPRLIARLYA